MSSICALPVQPPGGASRSADREELRFVYVDQLVMDARIGIYAEEQGRTQRLSVSVLLEVAPPARCVGKDIDMVVDYSLLRSAILKVIGQQHYGLQETLCDAIAARCLKFPGATAVQVRTGKLEAFSDCVSVGCVLSRRR